MNETILLVEDNPDILRINSAALALSGYRVLEAQTIAHGRARLLWEDPALVILDILLPDGSGLDFCAEIRAQSDLPILFLSALGENRDIIKGLMRGGDDYLSKPYDLHVMLARVGALLRRAGRRAERAVLVRGAIAVDMVSRHAYFGGEDALLTPKEVAILLCLMQNERRVINAGQLYETAWGMPMLDNVNAVRVAVSRLRKKLESAGFTITALRGSGYRFEAL